MADLDYNKFNWVQSAKERREAIVEEPTGIGAKPADQQEPMDKGFYESMYDAIMTYFDDAEEADRVLTAKEIDKDRVKGEVLREFDALDSLLSEDTKTPSLDYFDGIDRDVMEDSVQAQADRITETADATFEKPSGELVSGLKDVTDTEEGKLTNEEPLYKMAEEIDPGTIETKGIMSKPSDDSADGVQPTDGKGFVDSFVTAMGKAEGTEDHTDSLGIKTLGYGILPATAKKYGFDPDSEQYKNNRQALARDVYTKMNEDAVKTYPKVFEGLTDSQKVGVLSMYINLGELSDGVVTALSKDTPDFDEAKTSLAKVVLGSPRNEDGTRQKDKDGNTIYTSSKGLSKRRAKEYNTLMAGQADFKPVKTVAVEGTKAKPIFVWKDKDGNEVHRYEPSISGEDVVYQGLDKNSSMKAVSL